MSTYPLFLKNAFIFAVIVAFVSKDVKAQTALYIPGADPQPISADILGVGNDGRTTYLVQQGTPTDNEPLEGSFPKATLVEGPSDAFLTFSTQASDDAGIETIVGSVSCTISASQAVCTSSIQMALGSLTSSTSGINTEDASPIPIQLGSTVNAPAATTGASSGFSTVATGSSTAAPGSLATNSGASTASTGAGATNTGSSNKNGAMVVHRATDSMIALGLLVILVSSLL